MYRASDSQKKTLPVIGRNSEARMRASDAASPYTPIASGLGGATTSARSSQCCDRKTDNLDRRPILRRDGERPPILSRLLPNGVSVFSFIVSILSITLYV